MKILLLILLSLNSFAQTTILELGQSKTYSGSAKQIWIEKSTILKADSINGQLRLTAKKIGSTKIRINSTNETIEVVHPDQLALYEKVKSLVSKRPGLHTEIENGEVVVKGYLHDWNTWKTLADEMTFSHFKMRAELSPILKDSLQKNFDQELKTRGLLSVNIIHEPSLEVRLNPKQPSLDRYREYFERLGVNVVTAEDSLELLPVIRVDITVVEINKESSRKIGMQWPGQANFEVLPGKLITSEALLATLHAMETQGNAKMLASPNLICRSGKEAEFLAGGEFPIKIASFKMQDIIWKKYGVLLKIRPQADSSGRISLSIDTEVSSLGPMVEGIPSIQSNRVSSHFDLSHTQVVALSGLLKDDESYSAGGLPFLTQIPILGTLFSSRDYRNKKTELVIFVRPRLMDQQPAEEWTKGSSHAKSSL